MGKQGARCAMLIAHKISQRQIYQHVIHQPLSFWFCSTLNTLISPLLASAARCFFFVCNSLCNAVWNAAFTVLYTTLGQMGVVVFPFHSKPKHKADKKSKNSRHSSLKFWCISIRIRAWNISMLWLFAPLPRFPSHRSHCSGGTGVSVMLTLTNWFVSLFRTLLKVGQSLDVLEIHPVCQLHSHFAPTDNNLSCYSENALQLSCYPTWRSITSPDWL